MGPFASRMKAGKPRRKRKAGQISGEPNEIGYVGAIDELRAGNKRPRDFPRQEYERVAFAVNVAGNTDAAGAGMIRQKFGMRLAPLLTFGYFANCNAPRRRT